MHLLPDYRVFWRDATTVQIGLDERTAFTIEGLNLQEQNFLSHLHTPRNHSEIELLAKEHSIPPERLTYILALLIQEKIILTDDNILPPSDEQVYMLSRSTDRSHITVEIAHLDSLGIAIGLALARSGIGGITFSDTATVTTKDHPILQRNWLGLPRAQAFHTALRHASPHIRTSGESQLTVITGSHLVDPISCENYMRDNTPHVLAWVEEVDICVGPFVDADGGACSLCLYHHRAEKDKAWNLLAPQASYTPPLAPPAESLELAASLAARGIVAYLDGYGNPLKNITWRIPPNPDWPYKTHVSEHEKCEYAQKRTSDITRRT